MRKILSMARCEWRGRRDRLASAWFLVLLASAWGCELAEVAAPPSENLLVVESVLRVGAVRQMVLLHRTIAEGAVQGEPGARVELHGPGGERWFFREGDDELCARQRAVDHRLGALDFEVSCYLTDRDVPVRIEPGAAYELAITTLRGEELRGRTTVPHAFDLRVPAVAMARTDRSFTCTLPAAPFELVWEKAEGAWSYFVALHLSGWGDELRGAGVAVPDPLELSGVSVGAADTTLAFPQNLGLFQRGSLDTRIFQHLAHGIGAGTHAMLVIVAADRNYTNALRGGRFNPSGSVRPSSIVGDGVGLFGSVVPLTINSVPSARSCL